MIRDKPVESRADLVWLTPPRLLSPRSRSIFVVAYDRGKPLPSWLETELGES